MAAAGHSPLPAQQSQLFRCPARISLGQLTAPSEDGFAPTSQICFQQQMEMGDRENPASIPLLVDQEQFSQHQAKVRTFCLHARMLHRCALAHRSRAGAAPFLPQAASSCLGETLFLEMPLSHQSRSYQSTSSPVWPPSCSHLIQVKARPGEGGAESPCFLCLNVTLGHSAWESGFVLAPRGCAAGNT